MRQVAVWLVLAPALSLGCAGSAPVAQHEIVSEGDLLTSDGKLREPGWARRQLLHWDPARVHDATKLRQWDFFTVEDDHAAVNLTIADLGFAQLASVGAVDFSTGAMHQAMLFKGSGGDSLVLSQAVEGDAALTPAGAAPAMQFHTTSDTTTATIAIPSSLLGDAADGSFTIRRDPAMEYLSLATPFHEDAHDFFYEQKIPGMTADGSITIGAQTWDFAGATATMDWGRGQWPSEVTWRWAAASGTVDGAPLSFNLGEGFGDPGSGTENLLVRGGVGDKLEKVSWTHDPNDPLADWTFQSERVSLTLHPKAKETGGLDFGARYEHLQKAYGTFSGTVTLADGSALTVDGLVGFAEEMNLAW